MNYTEIDEIMDHFDFDQVHKAMVALNWIWELDEVPEKSDLRKTAREMLKSVSEKDGPGYISTGGFIASKNDDGKLGLIFAVEEYP